MELQQKYGRDVPVTVLVGSIRDKARLDEVFETYHPTVVFHAAAHKHVPLMEISPPRPSRTMSLALRTCSPVPVNTAWSGWCSSPPIRPSTPPASWAAPSACEMLIQTFAGNTDMKCVAVRFGNVLGSHGSVIPLFEAQIKRAAPSPSPMPTSSATL